MDNIPDTIIYWPSVRVIAHPKENERKEALVELRELKWNQWEDGMPWLKLSEISEQLQKRGYESPYYVWAEMGLSGEIFMYGNYDPPTWENHGTTKGYA